MPRQAAGRPSSECPRTGRPTGAVRGARALEPRSCAALVGVPAGTGTGSDVRGLTWHPTPAQSGSGAKYSSVRRVNATACFHPVNGRRHVLICHLEGDASSLHHRVSVRNGETKFELGFAAQSFLSRPLM